MDDPVSALLAVADAMAQELQELSDEQGGIPATEALIAEWDQVKQGINDVSE